MDEFPKTIEVTWNVEVVDGDGDFGFSRGNGPMVLESEGKAVKYNCKWLSVHKKQSDGSWKLKNLCWNFDEPVSV
jgi:ketosteroid isomerase-like protein